jgi:tetratricopeptide (TPR) repeat protein
MARPAVWDKLLVDAVKNDKLFTLETINAGFARPKSGSEWNLAYCQADQYARYMIARFGNDALAKMLSAYAANLTTARAIEQSFHIGPNQFERGYQQHVRQMAAEICATRQERQQTLAVLRVQAREYLKSGQSDRLPQVLIKLAAIDSDGATIRKKLAVLAGERKDWPEAERWAGEAIHIDANDAKMHQIAGEAASQRHKYADAIHSYGLAVRLDERNKDARVGLVRAYAAAEQREQARLELEALKKRVPDDAIIPELEALLE